MRNLWTTFPVKSIQLAAVVAVFAAVRAAGIVETAVAGQHAERDDSERSGLTLTLHDKQLLVEAALPAGCRACEVRIESSRNDLITRFTTISPHDADAARRRNRYSQATRDTWYPVVDVRLELGMEGVCQFAGAPLGMYTFGGPFFEATCAYATGFLGLAILKELKHRDAEDLEQ